MDFLNCINQQENCFLKELRELVASGFPIYIYGGGFGAKQVANRLVEANIPYSGMAVDRKYWGGGYNIMFRRNIGSGTG